MELRRIVATSERIRTTRSRSQKTEAVADLLAGCRPEELPTAVAWMSGTLLQGRIGVSARRTHAFARDVAPAATASLSVAEVDEALVALPGGDAPPSCGSAWAGRPAAAGICEETLTWTRVAFWPPARA